MDRQSREFTQAVLDAVKQKMFGVDEVVRLSLVALYTGGHVLLEGNPGLGKTELVKTLGRVLKLPAGRIQFTPDLMPTDITGTFMPDFENHNLQKLVFRHGPIFTSLLLADEINRATPKTQAAMLEAMAEQQVTVLGWKETLDTPFMVLATQNPIDHEGTYNLPEAQADRFMFKIAMPVPDRHTLDQIVHKRAGVAANSTNHEQPEQPTNNHLLPANKDASKKEYERLHQKIIEKVKRSPRLKTHIANMFLASNRRFDQLEELDRNQKERTHQLVELMRYGLSPRAAITMTLGAKAWSLMFLAEADCAAGPALARVVIPTLRHRLKLTLDWDEQYRKIIKKAVPLNWRTEVRQNSEDNTTLLERILADFCISTAPKTNKYQWLLIAALNQVIQEREW